MRFYVDFKWPEIGGSDINDNDLETLTQIHRLYREWLDASEAESTGSYPEEIDSLLESITGLHLSMSAMWELFEPEGDDARERLNIKREITSLKEYRKAVEHLQGLISAMDVEIRPSAI